MEQVRLAKLEKYMEFGVKPTNNNIETFSLETITPNIFYGYKEDNNNLYIIKEDEFNDNFIVLRLLDIYDGFYTFRVLKSNKDEKVDSVEELEYLKCRIF